MSRVRWSGFFPRLNLQPFIAAISSSSNSSSSLELCSSGFSSTENILELSFLSISSDLLAAFKASANEVGSDFCTSILRFSRSPPMNKYFWIWFLTASYVVLLLAVGGVPASIISSITWSNLLK